MIIFSYIYNYIICEGPQVTSPRSINSCFVQLQVERSSSSAALRMIGSSIRLEREDYKGTEIVGGK